MSSESWVTVPPDSAGKRLRSINEILSGQNAASSVWSEVITIGDPNSGAIGLGGLALVNASGALSVSTSGDAVSVSGNIVGVYAASQQSGWMAVISGVGATSGQVQVASSGLGTVAVSSGSVIPVLAASFQSGWAAVVSGVGATSGQLNVASSGIGAVAIASGGIIPISIISGNVVALSGIVEIVSGQTVTVVSSGIGTIAVSSGGVIPTMLASAQSGGLVGISGGGLTISGGVTISGSVMVSGVGNTSGQLNVASSGLGTVAISSGGILPVGLTGYQSGVLVGISGGSVGLSGLQGIAISGSVTVVLAGYQSGILVVMSGVNVDYDNADGLGTGRIGLDVSDRNLLYNGATWDRARTIAGSSGASTGVLATQQVGYSYALISGTNTLNIKNGAAYLHTINVGWLSSGGTLTVYDSSSGVGGAIEFALGNGALLAQGTGQSYVFDTLHTSGIVVQTSGTQWQGTAVWRTA